MKIQTKFRQFSLGSALTAVVLVGLFFSWISMSQREIKRKIREDSAIKEHGAYQVTREDGSIVLVRCHAENVTTTLTTLLEKHCEIREFLSFDLSVVNDRRYPVPQNGLTDSDVLRISRLPRLRTLGVHGRGVTRQSIGCFLGMQELLSLILVNTSISQAEADELMRARPGLVVVLGELDLEK